MAWLYPATLLAANLALLLPPASPLRVAGALLLTGLLPGLSWAHRFFPGQPSLLRWTLAAALSFGFTLLITLLLSYLPGPLPTWSILISLNLLALLPLLPHWRNLQPSNLPSLRLHSGQAFQPSNLPTFQPSLPPLPLLFILLIALLLRTNNLDYSEFQGDEALALITAAEALEGHEDALFLRSKGPGEVLLPMALWRLSGLINEPIARLPFTAAALLAIVSVYLIGQKMGGSRLGWLAAGFFAFNGFMVAFGRIVQYQALVIWFSTLAYLLTLLWYETHQNRFMVLAGLSLGLGLLAHYDAILVAPAIGWLLISRRTEDRGRETGENKNSGLRSPVSGLILFILALLLTALPFYLPFALDPQANRTGDYVGGRIGSELRNNLPDFFHFNTFYSSSYYLIVTGLLVLAALIWLVWPLLWSRWPGLITLVALLWVSFNPTWLVTEQFNLSILPFALLFALTFLALLAHPTSPLSSAPPLLPTPYSLLPLLLWLAVPFLGYNFIVALGLTHIYTIVPAWSLLAAIGWHLIEQGSRGAGAQGRNHPCPSAPLLPGLISNGLLLTTALLSTLFLWNAFIRHDIEYWQDYPAGNLPFYWTPYAEPPQAGFFGFAHRTGWKTVGQKIAGGQLSGDYGSNEEPDVTTWYTRGAPRACDPQPEFYFLADDLIDPVEVPTDLIASAYAQIGRVTLPNQKQLRIMQLQPSTLTLGDLADAPLAAAFDQTATPAAFARSARGAIAVEANFGNLIRLIGYDLDTRRAYSGGRIPVTLYWQALAPIPASYQVFTHLEGQNGPVAQADSVPVCWTYPTEVWRPGQIIADQHAIPLKPETPPGDYPLQVGLYLPDTFARLDVLDEAGNPAGNSVTLTQVRLK
jgi:4-amino-4-deoxy-L-arabinose transferase-like glycosyltransferase